MLIGLLSKAIQLCGRQKIADMQMIRAAASGMGALVLMIGGLISLACSGYFWLIDALFSPKAASLIMAIILWGLAGIMFWMTDMLIRKKSLHQERCFEDLLRAFIEGYSCEEDTEHEEKKMND